MKYPETHAAPWRPIRVLFVNTALAIGGAETCVVNLIHEMNRGRFAPEICCLKELGPLGAFLPRQVPRHANVLHHKLDLAVLSRLRRLMMRRQIQAVVTVGAGDKMFWGRLAAKLAGVRVIVSALHSTGWPDNIGFLNHRLTPLTDGFIALSRTHAKYLTEREGLPPRRVFVIPNGVDTEKFSPSVHREPAPCDPHWPGDAQVVGIVARLSPEKNHEMFLEAAANVRSQCPAARFLIVGDGPERRRLEALAARMHLEDVVRFAGAQTELAPLYRRMHVFALSSRMEAAPLTILESLSCGIPVVATNVGSIPELVSHARHGFLVEPTDVQRLTRYIIELLRDDPRRVEMGRAGREFVLRHHTLAHMARGYEDLLEQLLAEKTMAGMALSPQAKASL